MNGHAETNGHSKSNGVTASNGHSQNGLTNGAVKKTNQITIGATAQSSFDTSGYPKGRKDDPYIYQVGFGNMFASQALPGVLPEGQNSPQNNKYDLYAEGINGTSMTAPRASNQRTWLYRILPSLSHNGTRHTTQNPYLESDFSPSNPKVHVNHTQITWSPHTVPTDEKVNFIHGIRTMGGNGTAVSKEGMAMHIYVANEDMEKTALVNNDGDFLIVPDLGRLDIQTEFGRLMVAPGEIVVIQSGMRFRVSLPDGPSRGTIYEVFGNHFVLPELGPLGANGMAHSRDFEYPVASFDVDQTQWSIIHKTGGKLFEAKQNHTPFDVVAWHGNYIPYKYDLNKFSIVQATDKDHTDPSVYCVLMVQSKLPGISFLEFCVFHAFWTTTENTFRPPYFHRNSAAEYVGFVKGGRGPGGMFGYSGFIPHGPTEAEWQAGATEELVPKRLFEGTIGTLIEPYQMLLLTDYAITCKEYSEYSQEPYTYLPNFLKHLDNVNAELKASGRPEITPLL
ncbi:homogentisate 1,2-dioxygenase [Cristinia sonorae]|uniref:homogentisate 1,2-dioxygenase n=1 Tax=Cristinia sonorae TaxID=1940300 RepID=A0A8K0UIK5_9AGAR|nr:homogentisate 1,2-dioxygenase [Cristinia sonorae]